MSTFNESHTIQALLFGAAGKNGWEAEEADALPKEGRWGGAGCGRRKRMELQEQSCRGDLAAHGWAGTGQGDGRSGK